LIAPSSLANAFCAFDRLVQRRKEADDHPTPLAWYAIKQVRTGRRVGGKLNIDDITSPYARASRGIAAERRGKFDHENNEWRAVLVEDRRAGPAEIAASRIDVAAWFRSLDRTKRRIAKLLARGEATGTVARKFGLSPGRISQLRAELQQSWLTMQGEPVAA
jgi:hypothetical protein